jgi:Uma2 family endonuclease
MEKAAVKRMTYADYVLIPPDGKRHEIIEGEWYMTPAPEVPHQRISRNLGHLLHEHVDRNRLGEVLYAPVDVLLSDEDVVEPDLIFISSARAAIVTQKNIQGAPDLVVEILSPSTASIDRNEKRRLYERGGLKEYWIVDVVNQTVEIHEFGSPRRTRIYTSGQSFDSALLPGLTVRLADLF